MPRPERVVDPAGEPVQEFAHQLRELRARVGGPGYRELAKRTSFSATTLAEAAGGRRLPTLEVTPAYVEACGGDTAEWRGRWQAISAALAADRHDEVLGSEHDAPFPGLVAFQSLAWLLSSRSLLPFMPFARRRRPNQSEVDLLGIEPPLRRHSDHAITDKARYIHDKVECSLIGR